MATYNWTAGRTSKRQFRMTENGSAVNLSSLTLSGLVLTKPDGSAVDTSGDIAIDDAANGVVSYTPDAADLSAADSPLRARWKFTNGSGGLVFFPEGEADTWKVFAQ